MDCASQYKEATGSTLDTSVVKCVLACCVRCWACSADRYSFLSSNSYLRRKVRKWSSQHAVSQELTAHTLSKATTISTHIGHPQSLSHISVACMGMLLYYSPGCCSQSRRLREAMFGNDASLLRDGVAEKP